MQCVAEIFFKKIFIVLIIVGKWPRMKRALMDLKTVFMCSNPVGAFDKVVINLGRRYAMDRNYMQWTLRFYLIRTDVESGMN
jgi:hypothetical protein